MLLALTTGCSAKESKYSKEASCTKACENVAHIMLEDLDRKVGSGQGAATSTVKMKPEGAQRIYQQVKKDCIEKCEERASKKKIECLKGASNKSDVDGCR